MAELNIWHFPFRNPCVYSDFYSVIGQHDIMLKVDGTR